MFFSLIIPTYNPREHLPKLLESVTKNECVDDIEVIISDDCSTEKFDDIIANFPTLHIQTISNKEHSGFPRNGRQHGSEVAQGTWMTFADQDDYFEENAFDSIKAYIEEKNCHNYIISNVIIEEKDTYEIIFDARDWTHGKFIEKKFWDDYNICYDEIQYCEDVNISTKIACILHIYKLAYYFFDGTTYHWVRHDHTLSSELYFMNSFPDYISSTLKIVMDFAEKCSLEDKEVSGALQYMFLKTFLVIYFYTQTPFFINNKQKLLEILLLLQPHYNKFLSVFNYTKEVIITLVNNELFNVYLDTRDQTREQAPVFEQISFRHWLEVYFD